MSNDLDTAQKEKISMENDLANVKLNLANLTSELTTAKELNLSDSSKSEELIGILQNEKRTLVAECQNLKTDIEKLTTSNDDFVSAISSKEEKISEIKKLFENVQAENCKLETSLKSIQAQLETLKSASVSNESEMTQKLDEKNNLLESTNQELAESQLENNKLSKEITLFKTEIEKITEKLDITTKFAETSTIEKEKLAEEVSILKSEVSSLNENVESKTKIADEKHVALESLEWAHFLRGGTLLGEITRTIFFNVVC